MIENLPDKLREVTGLTTFAELFGFNWHDDSVWYWSDVAEKMALEIEEYSRVQHGHMCYECHTGGIPATEDNMAEYGWVRERTCSDVCADVAEFTCSACGFNCDLTSWIKLFDGDTGRHRHHHHGTPNYCPNCGAKVVQE